MRRTAICPLKIQILTTAKYIHCVSKKVPTFKLSVTLSNLNRISKFLHCWKAYEICHAYQQCKIYENRLGFD